MTNKNNLTKDFMKEIEGIDDFKLMEELMPNLRHHKLDLENCFILRKDKIEQTLSKLSKEYISIKEHHNEIRKLSKWETPRIKKLKEEHEKEVMEWKENNDEILKVLKHIRRKYKPYKKRYEELKQQLSQSISIKEVEKIIDKCEEIKTWTDKDDKCPYKKKVKGSEDYVIIGIESKEELKKQLLEKK